VPDGAGPRSRAPRGSARRGRAAALSGKGFEVHGPLANDVFAEAIDEVSDAVGAWTEAGERYDVAVREVVADSYRRHRAATMLVLT
jgi:hypothetical protein